jgi:uncharacterized phage protein gp47/JayE
VSYVPRAYDQIVRDILTTLTGGTVRETVKAPAANAVVTPAKLLNRPVRRISSLDGVIGTPDKPVNYRFTASDFELISTSGDDNNKDAIRFRDGGRRPIPNSDLTVNYYPVQTPPVPLNDLNIGSVVRSLLETVAVEMAVVYQHLAFIYDSAYIETAQGSSLDKVVALVGVKRLGSGFPIVKLRFARKAGTPGRITIPANTAVTDDSGHRYLTNEELILDPGESSRDVLASGETPGTPDADANKLDRLEVLVAGVDTVTNPNASYRLSASETDDQLRRRAQGAFDGVARGTLDALRFQLLSLAEVKDVKVTEEPNGVPGEIRIDIAYNQDTPEAEALVAERIRQVKPAGIRVIAGTAAARKVHVRVALTLAGTGVSGPDLSSLEQSLESVLVPALNSTPPGGAVRRSKLLSLVMSDSRIADAKVYLSPDGGAEAEELMLDSGEVLQVVTPVVFSPPQTEEAVTTRVNVKVSAMLPLHLTPGTTQADAQQAIDSAFTSHLATRSSDAPLTLDSVAAAIRDDSRFALVRDQATVTVESGTRFFQLTDGVGSYAPAPNETLQKDQLNLDIREGGV